MEGDNLVLEVARQESSKIRMKASLYSITDQPASSLPTVSVIVLNYNGRRYLRACFDSLLALTYPSEKLELFFADNASQDDSVTFMRSHFPSVRVITNLKNYGFAKGNNLAAEQASGELVVFLNNDMRVEPDWLIALVHPFLLDDSIGAVGSRILSWDGQEIDFAGGAINFLGFGYQLGWGKPSNNGLADLPDLGITPTFSVCGGAMAVRRELFLFVGGFDSDFFAYYEDTDLSWRLWVLGHRVVMAHCSIVYHVHHGSWAGVADQRKRVLYERNALLSVFKNYADPTLSTLFPAALLMLCERALFASKVSRKSYFIGEATSPVVQSDRIELPVPSQWDQLAKRAQGLFSRKASFSVKIKQVNVLVLSLLNHGVRRSLQVLANGLKLDMLIVPRQTASYLIAADHVIALLPRMLEKRAFIQAHRQRSDAEVLAQTGLLFETNYFNEPYTKIQQDLIAALEIEKLLSETPNS